VTIDGPGRALAQAREAAGITQREVSDALNLPITTIDAIECDDREHLPADVFSRGYIRAYARLLELDPGPLVAAFGGSTESEKQLIVPSGPRMSGINAQLRALLTPKALLVGVGIMIVIIVLVVWLAGGDDSAQQPVVAEKVESGSPVQPGAAVQNPVDANAVAGVQSEIPAVDESVQSVDSDSISEPVSASSVTSAEVATLAAAPISAAQPGAAAQETPVLPDTPVGVRRLTPLGDDRLSFDFTEECWVEIKDPVGNMLYGNLGRPGARLEFVGAAPFRVLLGYAPGVLLKYNAEPVALGPHTRNNVASLVLGQ
jgi:cytoskeleton protein RodZ